MATTCTATRGWKSGLGGDCFAPSPGTPGEGGARVFLRMTTRLDLEAEPSPQPSPGLPGEGARAKTDLFTPFRCRTILVALLLLGAVGHIQYLNHNCPLDLSGDEAQSWDWSRQLDLSYYSKGPLVAYIIRASRAIFGETMPAVRYPAIALGLGTAVMTYLLTAKLFGSERLALGAVLLGAVAPIFLAGSIFMTIDPPLFFCWAYATYFLALALFDRREWAWLVVGVFVGVGLLAKYAMLLWLASM